MWEGGKEFDIIDYKIHIEVGDQIYTLYTSEDSMIELTYKIIKPFIRDCKLNKIGV